ncbi:Proteinase inhibitor I3, Kunitz legume [Corchorus olitorius]|uniref:Proteinase inhibitor I3, Kunitz legume n=1 Tax=Corchorus olitorius TaxID=93759 RepID=A0A1R3JJ88_9ROSI|nr:Proteinase inhibitor I3, Kunitz legume [Corchorus olitorius]
MKTMSATALLLAFFLVFSTKSSFFVEVANAAAVLDIDGNEVLTGVEYYVVSIIRGAGGGGLALDEFGFGRCPLAVLQRTLDTDRGDPLTFWPVNNDSVVSQSTDLNIEFVPPFSAWCRSSNTWRLDNYDPSSGKWWVTTGATKGQPGANTLTNWFRIENASGNGYKFSFCPSVCESCISLCNDVGIYDDEDPELGKRRRLALSPQPWRFQLIKTSRVIEQVA